ncbi:MAG TPA: redoxin domain-containing protein [Verrucomicrobiae bacterium]|nr:redoxin domain-containing protein [Verrucomicrobiae bacterium]
MKYFLNPLKLALVMVALIGARTGLANLQDFTVQSVTGTNVFKLSDARGKFVALHFLLKTECPYCIRHTHDYAQKSASDSRVVHIFLKPDTETEIKQWAGKLGGDSLKVNIYRDPDAKLAKEFNIPDGYKFHGQTVHYPALILLDANGKEVFRYVGKSNADRLSYDNFATKLDEITKSAR